MVKIEVAPPGTNPYLADAKVIVAGEDGVVLLVADHQFDRRSDIGVVVGQFLAQHAQIKVVTK